VKFDAVRPRPALRAIEAGLRFGRAHGRLMGRARAFCATADLLELQRPRDWRRRADRLYARAVRDLQGIVVAAPTIPGDGRGDDEPAQRRAHRLLRLAGVPYRRMALALAALGSALALAVAVVLLIGSGLSPALRARLFPRDLAAGAVWVASSAVLPGGLSGVGPSTEAKAPFFHSQPSDHPRIEIDLGAPRVIRRLQVENRPDCCQARGLPLDFQLFDVASARWRTVTQRRAGFMLWTRRLDPVRARRVRLQVAGFGILHLRRISLYEW
jgi:hypothetical protein